MHVCCYIRSLTMVHLALQVYCITTDVFITPTIIRQALRKLKPGKGDGDRGFKSDHLLHSTHRFHVLLCLLFNIYVSSWVYTR